uniref:FBD domain-containing protein n=1 Tax=Steinernema glaseri TaxID=37863 RepID=A0A1I7ZGE8_9BILA
MQSVPYDFIERTILLVAPPSFDKFGTKRPSPFTSLQCHWGRYAKRLLDQTEHYSLYVNVHHLPDLYGWALLGETRVHIEDVLQKKRINIAEVWFLSHPQPDPLEKVEKETVQSLLRRCSSTTIVTLFKLPGPSSEVAAVLESIPRVSDLSVVSKVHDEPAFSALVEKHLQRGCLRSLEFIYMVVPSSLFPAVRTFLEESRFVSFSGKFAMEEEDFVKELASLLAANFKKRKSTLREVDVEASQVFVEALHTELGGATEEWPGTLSTRLRPPQEAPFHEIVAHFQYSTYSCKVIQFQRL